MPAQTRNLPSKLTVDFSDVEDRKEGGGKAAHVPEGDYLLRVEDADVRENKAKDGKYINWKLSIQKPSAHKNAGLVWHRTTLKKEGLWSLRNFLEDLGIKVPKSSVDIPLAKIVAAHPMIGATLVDDDPYENKIKSKIAGTFKKSEYTDDGASPTSTKAKDASDDEEDDEETEATADPDEEEEDLDELDVDDL